MSLARTDNSTKSPAQNMACCGISRPWCGGIAIMTLAGLATLVTGLVLSRLKNGYGSVPTALMITGVSFLFLSPAAFLWKMDKTEEPDLFFKVAVTLARGKIKSKYVGEKISSISFEEFEKILNDDARHDDLMAKLEADFERKFEKIFGTEFEALFKTEYDAMLRAKPKKGCEPEFGPAFQEKLRQMFGQEFETNLQNHNFTIRSALQTLGLDPTKVHTKVEIKQKFKAMCLETHPDKNPGASANAFNAVMEAHNFLKEQMERQGLEQISA